MQIELAGILIYLVILIGIGVVASRRMHDLRDYFAAGKKLNYFAVAFSARATGESAWLLLGLTGMGALVGAKAFWVVLGEIIGVGGAWIFMSRRFKRLTDRYDSITMPDYLESRFRDTGHAIRQVSAAALVVFVTIYVSAQIDATGSAFESFLGWNYFTGAIFGFAVVMAYIIGGGFLAVVWSDIFQGLMMVIGLVLLPIVGLVMAGGWNEVASGLRAQDPGLLSPWGPGGFDGTTIASILGLSLIGLGFLGSPQIFVRFLALRSEDEIRRGTAVAIAWTLLADCGAVFTGMIGRHLLVGVDGDFASILGSGGESVLPELVQHAMPALIVGIYIAVVLAAIMSTVDSLLIVASSAVVRDYYQKVLHPTLPDSGLVRLSRVTTAILALFALGIAMTVATLAETRTIFWFVVFGWSGIAATFCPTVILSLFWRGMTARGALCAMITGFACVPLFKFGITEIPGAVGVTFAELGELGPAFLVSMAVGVIVSATDPKGRERLAGIESEMAG